jgi:hypothetical protein
LLSKRVREGKEKRGHFQRQEVFVVFVKINENCIVDDRHPREEAAHRTINVLWRRQWCSGSDSDSELGDEA